MVKRLSLYGRVSFVVFVLAFFISQNVWALTDSERIKELEQKLQQSIQTIDELSGRVRNLEKELGEQKKAAVAAPAPVAEQQPAVEPVSPVPSSFALHGYADVDFGLNTKRNNEDDKIRGFATGKLDLFVNPQFGNNGKGIAELIFEHSNTGETEMELHRLFFDYSFNDLATVRAGRFLTPLGYWNEQFVHNAQTQTSILRPTFLDDDEGVMPLHMVGLLGYGGGDFAGGKLKYEVYFTNGARITNADGGGGQLDSNNLKNDKNAYTAGINLNYEFRGGLEGLRLGGHFLHGGVNSYDADGQLLTKTGLNIVGGYALYNNYNWEVISEFYDFIDKDRSNGTGTHSSWAGFIQAGHTFFDRLTPYARLEKAHLDLNDSYFSQQANGKPYSREALGVRYDLTPRSCIKLELTHTKITDREAEKFNEMRMQYAVAF